MVADKCHPSSGKMRNYNQVTGSNFVNCSNFKIVPDEDYYKMADDEKDYRQMIISTPPSNINKEAKFGIIVNSI